MFACASCGNMINEGDKFCQYCGSLVVAPQPEASVPEVAGAVCASCGGALEDGDRFCQHCGTPVAAPQVKEEVIQVEAVEEVVEEAPVEEIAGAVCASCGGALAADDKFCQNCGTPVAAPQVKEEVIQVEAVEEVVEVVEEAPVEEITGAVCASCGGALAADDKFCQHCGTPVAAPAVVEVTEDDLAEIEEIIEAPVEEAVEEAAEEVVEEVIGAICPECGGANDTDSKFCQFCGAVLEVVEEACEEVAEIVEEEVIEEVIQEEVPEEVVVEEEAPVVEEEAPVEEAVEACEPEAPVAVAEPMGYDYPYLVRRATREVIDVNKAFFRIGSEKNVNNYVVDGIGGMHAMIMTTAGKYFIVDLGTEGKTYVGGAEIAPDTEVELTAGCSVRLANEDFVFII